MMTNGNGQRGKSLFEVRHPFFRPMWRRALVTLLCFGWTIFELSNGSYVWAVLFGACGAYLFHQYFVVFDPADYEAPDPE